MMRWLIPFLFLPLSLAAQERIPSHCIALAGDIPGATYIHRAAWRDRVPADSVRITYIDHATFMLQTPGGLMAMTDYTGIQGPVTEVPDVVTMNNAHSSHYTWAPDPRIPHVLEGWAEGDQPRAHSLDLGEMLVRNVTTDIRSFGGTNVVKHGNSIFVFEVAGLCIGHLGHLHHEPDAVQYAQLGRLDVVMAAVDGGVSLDLPTMIRVMKRLKSRVVIPMHWFGRYTLDEFLRGMEDEFDVVRTGESEIVLSLDRLPSRPMIMVLEPLATQ